MLAARHDSAVTLDRQALACVPKNVQQVLHAGVWANYVCMAIDRNIHKMA